MLIITVVMTTIMELPMVVMAEPLHATSRRLSPNSRNYYTLSIFQFSEIDFTTVTVRYVYFTTMSVTHTAQRQTQGLRKQLFINVSNSNGTSY